MEERLEKGIYRGRPFGGVSVAWSEDLNNFVIPLSNYRHKRVVGIEVKAEPKKLIILSVYMPFLDTRSRENREMCLHETIDTITMIENIIDDFPDHYIIVGGDLNYRF